MVNLVTFREAKQVSSFALLARSSLQLLLFCALLYGAVPFMIVKAGSSFGLVGGRFEVPWWVSSLVFACGLTTMLWATACLTTAGRGTPWYGACPRKLAMTGPYRFIRNPLILGLAIQGIAVGLAWGSPWVFVYVTCGGPLWQALLRPAEEADLEVRFRGDYRLYKQAVPCWLPRLSPYRPRV